MSGRAVLRVMAGLLCSWACPDLLANSASAPALVPIPQKMQVRPGAFTLQPDTPIQVDLASQPTGEYLAAQLRPPTGYPCQLEVLPDTDAARPGILLTTQRAKAELGAEGYELTVTPRSVVLRAPTQAGLFYGLQTLLQLLPPEIFARQPVCGAKWTVPLVRIKDQPRFQWRGFMLDVSRHFFRKQEIKQLLDLMALHKLNTFHWHLANGVGWRLEIKKYPLLTEVGAWRKGLGWNLDPKASTAYGPDGRYGGFYTHAEVREIVAYAQARHIAIVPEIAMPAHSRAALSAYPELSCSGTRYTTEPDAKVSPSPVFCPGNEKVFEFLQAVLAEVIDLFPGKYIHIGGDEVNKENWKQCARCQARMRAEGLKSERELQAYFTRRLQQVITARGRTLLGWSEILDRSLAPNAAIMDWMSGAAEAARMGYDVVLTPTNYCYLDYWQSSNHAAEPPAFGGDLPLDKVYSFEPMPAGLDRQLQHHILGAQGNLWTEYVPSLAHAQYMAFPRLCALAELTWSPKASRNYGAFTDRLHFHFQRFDQLGVRYRKWPEPHAQPTPGP